MYSREDESITYVDRKTTARTVISMFVLLLFLRWYLFSFLESPFFIYYYYFFFTLPILNVNMEGYNFVLWYFFFLLFFSFFPPPVSRVDHTWSSRLEMFIFKVKRGERKKNMEHSHARNPKTWREKKGAYRVEGIVIGITNSAERTNTEKKKKVVMKCVRENFKTLLSIGKREGERTTEGTIDIWFTRGQSNCCLHNTTNGANNIVYNTSLC